MPDMVSNILRDPGLWSQIAYRIVYQTRTNDCLRYPTRSCARLKAHLAPDVLSYLVPDWDQICHQMHLQINLPYFVSDRDQIRWDMFFSRFCTRLKLDLVLDVLPKLVLTEPDVLPDVLPDLVPHILPDLVPDWHTSDTRCPTRSCARLQPHLVPDVLPDLVLVPVYAYDNVCCPVGFEEVKACPKLTGHFFAVVFSLVFSFGFDCGETAVGMPCMRSYSSQGLCLFMALRQCPRLLSDVIQSFPTCLCGWNCSFHTPLAKRLAQYGSDLCSSNSHSPEWLSRVCPCPWSLVHGLWYLFLEWFVWIHAFVNDSAHSCHCASVHDYCWRK